jgi:hypothetical protein
MAAKGWVRGKNKGGQNLDIPHIYRSNSQALADRAVFDWFKKDLLSVDFAL